MLNHFRSPTNRIKRMRAGRPWIVSSILAMIAVLTLVGSSFAGGWCRADPVVEIDGQNIQIWVAIPDNIQPAVNGPIQVVVTKPWNANSQVLLLDAGFNGHGEKVHFVPGANRNADGSMNIDIYVVVPVDQRLLPSGTWQAPVMVEVITNRETTVVYGNNWWTSARITVGG